MHRLGVVAHKSSTCLYTDNREAVLLPGLWGARTVPVAVTWFSGGSLVFVEEAAEDRPALDAHGHTLPIVPGHTNRPNLAPGTPGDGRPAATSRGISRGEQPYPQALSS